MKNCLNLSFSTRFLVFFFFIVVSGGQDPALTVLFSRPERGSLRREEEQPDAGKLRIVSQPSLGLFSSPP